jgi:hypothetical protein
MDACTGKGPDRHLHVTPGVSRGTGSRGSASNVSVVLYSSCVLHVRRRAEHTVASELIHALGGWCRLELGTKKTTTCALITPFRSYNALSDLDYLPRTRTA